MALVSAYEGVTLTFDVEEPMNALLPPLHGSRADARHRTVVCRHWLKGLCQKGDNCEVSFVAADSGLQAAVSTSVLLKAHTSSSRVAFRLSNTSPQR
jgi:hypothetical protein